MGNGVKNKVKVMNLDVGGADICKDWRITYIGIVKGKVEVEVIDSQYLLVVQQADQLPVAGEGHILKGNVSYVCFYSHEVEANVEVLIFNG